VKTIACRLVLEGETEGNKPLGRPRHRRVDIIQVGLRKIGLGNWTGFIWLRIWPTGRFL
jgi:hypothetical protein